MISKIFNLEQQLTNQLACLKNEFDLSAVKAEFEAEGSSFRDLVRLRRLTAQQNIPLYLKIGGVEALRDLKDAFDLGVDGIIAPMVESPFGAVKFINAVKSIFFEKKIFKSINIETQDSVKNIDKILEIVKGKIDNITIGRTDLSQSYFDDSIKPDSNFIFDLVERLSYDIQKNGLTITVGGSVNRESIYLLSRLNDKIGGKITNIETRKVVLPVNQMLGQKKAFFEALRFEELYLQFKLECEEFLSRSERERLEEIKTRI
jgi:4-hydroxy-2-oxoheptanedioate aldolase